jgi:hypothetical protein
MTLIWIDSNTDKEIVYEFCKTSEEETRGSAGNYSVDNWENDPSTLMYKIYKEKIYDRENRGGYAAIVDEGKILVGAGVCQWSDDPNSCILYSRLYSRKEARGLPKARIIHLEFDIYDLAIELGYRGSISSFNKYNLKLREVTYNTNDPSRFPSYYSTDHNHHYTGPKGRRIIPAKKFEYPVKVNYVKQWLLYYAIDPSYEADLEQLLNKLAIK